MATDVIVRNCVILELKAVDKLQAIHEVQLVNYLRATCMVVGLLINFGRKLDVWCSIFTLE
ncbi:MAG: GxxExxY protein [Mariprofundaceae bacterium]